MARQQRIQYPGAWYHVTHRGAGRQDIYKNDIDRQVFLKQVAETTERYALEVHAYCLMTNHYHLLVRTPEANLSTAMRHLNSTYSQRFNRAHETDGPVFRGRYAAQVIGEDDYILAVIRYVHLNPSNAGLESELGTYRWSSLPAFLQLSRPPGWLKMTWVRSRFTNVNQFRQFINSGLGASSEPPPDVDETSLVLGSSGFREGILNGVRPSPETQASVASSIPKPGFASIIQAVRAVTGCKESELLVAKPGRRSNPRLMALCLAADLTDLNKSDLALIFGFKNHLGVSTALQTVPQVNAQDENFRALCLKATGIATSNTQSLDHLSTETGT